MSHPPVKVSVPCSGIYIPVHMVEGAHTQKYGTEGKGRVHVVLRKISKFQAKKAKRNHQDSPTLITLKPFYRPHEKKGKKRPEPVFVQVSFLTFNT